MLNIDEAAQQVHQSEYDTTSYYIYDFTTGSDVANPDASNPLYGLYSWYGFAYSQINRQFSTTSIT